MTPTQSGNGPTRAAGLTFFASLFVLAVPLSSNVHLAGPAPWEVFLDVFSVRTEWLGIRNHRRQARHLDAGLGWSGSLPGRCEGIRHHASPRQLRLRHQHGDMGPDPSQPHAARTPSTFPRSRPSSTPGAATLGHGWTRWERPSSTHCRPRRATTPGRRSRSPEERPPTFSTAASERRDCWCWSLSSSIFRYLLVDHAEPAMWRSLRRRG